MHQSFQNSKVFVLFFVTFYIRKIDFEFFFQGRLRPGRMLLVDTQKKVLVRDEELKLEIARLRPLRKWLRTEVIHLEHLHRDHQVWIFGFWGEDGGFRISW